MTRVAICIVNWNGKKDTLECLASIDKLVHPDTEISVIVVDNGSTDNSASVIKYKFSKTVVIKLSENTGFTGGNNAGIEHAMRHNADFIWLLNNDTVVDKNALINLLDEVDKSGGGVFGSKIYFFKGREFHHDRYVEGERGKVIWFAGGRIDWQNMYASHRGVDEVDHGQFDKQEQTPFVTGCSMFVKREVFDAIGLLDPKYFAYLEDLDFCLKAGRAGFSLWYVPLSLVWHKNAGSTGRPGNEFHEYYFTRNRLLIGMRFAPLRTKIALFRQGLGFIMSGPAIRRRAILDALFFRFGKQFVWIKT